MFAKETPAFLYDQSMYNEDDPREGLFRGYYFIQVRLLFSKRRK